MARSRATPARNGAGEKRFTITWDRTEFDQILEAVKVLNERERLDLTPTHFIRRATRKELEKVLDR